MYMMITSSPSCQIGNCTIAVLIAMLRLMSRQIAYLASLDFEISSGMVESGQFLKTEGLSVEPIW
jgi:hypothetical protein